MENIVSGFFKNSFTQEQQTLLYRGLGIAEVFNIGVPVTSAIQEEVMREQETQKEDIIDAIWDIINEGIDKIIFAHRITLNEEADLSFSDNLRRVFHNNPSRTPNPPPPLPEGVLERLP